MKKVSVYLCAALLSGLGACQSPEPDMTLNVDLASHEADFPSTMYGIFFEEINHAGDGGLYAEMLMNRSFEERVLPEGYRVENGELVAPSVMNHMAGRPTPGRYRWGTDPCPGWELSRQGQAEADMRLVTDQPNFATAPTSLQVDVKRLDGGVSLVNKGYWGVALQKDASYNLRMYVRSPKAEGQLAVRLLASDGRELGKSSFDLRADNRWHEYKAALTAADTTTAGRLAIDLPAEGTYYFDYVSLFPAETYKNRENGMRVDVARMLEGLHPAFIRWPGGCIVEGITLVNRVEWKKTLGDPAARPGQYDTWGYRNTYGFGYKEFLQFCEDIGAKGMYVCNVGISCQARSGEACTDKEAEAYLQDALDAIEYAIGDTDTRWGAVRASEGHPAPYPLAYVEIGNENSGPVYDRRFDMFYGAIKAKYPQLTLISNHGLGGVGTTCQPDMIDPHWYVEPEYFFKNDSIFDKHERGKYDVYVGEYACNQGVGGGNMLAALSEAAFITGMERNCDLVKMASYAPLLENRNDRGWPTNLIWMSNHQVVGRTSYYVQKMFAENKPTYNLKLEGSVTPEAIEPFVDKDGYVGVGTWSTQIQFRNLKVTDAAGKAMEADLADSLQWEALRGEWTLEDGAYTQSGNENRTALIWKAGKAGPGSTVEFEVKKLGGQEGFLFYLGLENADLKSGYMLNAGGWGNTATAIEKLQNGGSSVFSEQINDCLDEGNWHKVRVRIADNGADYYLDDKLILSHQNGPLKRKFYVAGYDEAANEVVLKVVNASDRPSLAQINLNGGDVSPVGRVITLSAASKLDENSFEEPLKIVPQETEYDVFASSFQYEFKPNSVNILRIKKK